MGKPKQHSNSDSGLPLKKVEQLGKSVRYIGIGGKVFSCPSCDRSFSRGMVYEHKNTMYCSRNCIVES